MKLIAALFVFAALLAPLHAQPQMLLDKDTAWRKQSGEWTVGEGTVAASASGTLSEYAASSGVALRGRWLSARIALEGDAAKAGLWLAGLRDEKGDLVRLTIDSTSGTIANGRGRTIATLPAGALEKPLELILKFETDALTLHSSGTEIGGFKVIFEDANPTPSLFVERGRAIFSDLIIGGEPAKPLTMKTAPVRKPVVQKLKPTAALTADFTEEKLLPLKSEWRSYFGIQTERDPGPWRTVRQFDGPSSALPLKPLTPGTRLDGPFNKTPVFMDLAWFRDPLNKTALGLDRNLPTIHQNGIDAIYIAPWRTILGKTEQDQIWALLKLAYGHTPEAQKHLYFQWGDDINSQQLGTTPTARLIHATPRHGVAYKRNANQPADALAYAENYLAPAIEATHKASTDLFGEPGKIPVMMGSCARAGLAENRDWFRTILDHTLTGEMAPSLKGKRVIDLIDYLTVNHPFADADDITPLQALWNTYGKQIRGLWITEEFGASPRNDTQLTTRIALFLEWVAANQLDAQQTRLIWDIASAKRGGDDCHALMLQLAQTMQGELRFATEIKETGTLHRIAAGATRLLLIYTPAEKKGSTIPIGDITLEVGETRAAKPWIARHIAGAVKAGVNDILPIRVDGSRLIVAPKATTNTAWVVLVEQP